MSLCPSGLGRKVIFSALDGDRALLLMYIFILVFSCTYSLTLNLSLNFQINKKKHFIVKLEEFQTFILSFCAKNAFLRRKGNKMTITVI